MMDVATRWRYRLLSRIMFPPGLSFSCSLIALSKQYFIGFRPTASCDTPAGQSPLAADTTWVWAERLLAFNCWVSAAATSYRRPFASLMRSTSFPCSCHSALPTGELGNGGIASRMYSTVIPSSIALTCGVSTLVHWAISSITAIIPARRRVSKSGTNNIWTLVPAYIFSAADDFTCSRLRGATAFSSSIFSRRTSSAALLASAARALASAVSLRNRSPCVVSSAMRRAEIGHHHHVAGPYPRVAIVDEIDIDVVEPERQRHARPEHAGGDLAATRP